jgi:hypothetical protein
LHGDNSGDVGKPRVEAAEAVEDERLVGHRRAHVTQGVRQRLQAMAVAGDGEIALNEATELRLEVDGPGHLIVEEEVGDE